MAATMPPLKRVATDRSGRFYETPDGDLLPSVTNILGVISKPALLNWYAKTEREMVIEAAADLFEDAPATPKMSRAAFIASLTNRIGKTKAAVKEVQKAQEIGSQCHALIEWNLRKELGQEAGPEPHITDKATWAFMAWEDWRKTVDLEPVWIEQAVYSRKHRFAGTLDLVARLNLKDETRDYGRVVAVIDWKTGKAIYPEAKLQNAAYSWAYCEMGHAETPPPGLVLRLPKIESDPNFEPMIVHEPEIGGLLEAFLAARDLWLWQQKAEAARNTVRAVVEKESLEEKLRASLVGGGMILESRLSDAEKAKLAGQRAALEKCSRCGDGGELQRYAVGEGMSKERICRRCFLKQQADDLARKKSA